MAAAVVPGVRIVPSGASPPFAVGVGVRALVCPVPPVPVGFDALAGDAAGLFGR
jgi:hypothetical protein